MANGRRLLTIGCGDQALQSSEQWPEVVNLDILPLPKVDVVWDLNHRPWPFPDEAFDSIIANNILEHLDDMFAALEEIHRILKGRCANDDAGLLEVAVPLAGSFNHYTDATHRRGFTLHTFDPVLGLHTDFYSWARFRLWKVFVETNYAGLRPRVELLGDGVENDREVERIDALNRPYGTDLRFMLAKEPADERIRALHQASFAARRTHSMAGGLYYQK